MSNKEPTLEYGCSNCKKWVIYKGKDMWMTSVTTNPSILLCHDCAPNKK